MHHHTLLEAKSTSVGKAGRQSQQEKRLRLVGGRKQPPALPLIAKAEGTENDLFSIKPRDEVSLRILPFTTAALILFSYYYWWLQYGIIRRIQNDHAEQSSEIAWRKRFLILEVLCAVPHQLKTLADSLAIFAGSWRPRLRLLGSAVPAVDVAIVCCKEPLDVILDTVRAALNTDYPAAALRLVVSDDGAQRSVEAGVTALQRQHPSRRLFYTARRKTAADSHKAGNLNHVLRFLAAQPGGAAEYVAGLDADMIAERHWLRAQLPHLLRDPAVAFTCPPPRFYNVPVDDPLAQSLRVFQRFEEAAKDRAGFPWCTGSGWVMRSAALADVGGFPERSVTEDLLLGNLILGRGWKAAYALESLQWGMVPDSFHAHVEQRKRWSTGAVQAGAIMKFCLFGDGARHLNLWQRLLGFACPFQSCLATLRLLEVLLNLAFFAGGWSNAVHSSTEELRLLVRAAAIVWILDYLRRCSIAVLCGYATAFRDVYHSDFLNSYWAVDHWRTFVLPAWLGGKEKAFSARFVATGSIVDHLHERDPKRRAPLRRRLKSVLFQDGAIFHLLVGLAFVLALGKNVERACSLYLNGSTSDFWTFLLTRLFWLPPTWPSNIVIFLRPVHYALFPPSMPDREELLVRDQNGVAYPTEEARNPKLTHQGFGTELFYTLATIYALGMLMSTRWW